MCFSVGASFTAGALLSVVGLLSLHKTSQKHLFFGAIPCLFGIQQIAEGFVWFSNSFAAAFVFLFFALVVWPIWVPLSVHIAEKNKKRKQISGALLALGIVFSSVFTAALIANGVIAQVAGCSIIYSVPSFFPGTPSLWGLLLYVCATVLPFFVFSLPGSSFIGFLLIFSAVISWLIWYAYFTSIWCFFAAIISIFVLIYLPHKQA